MPGTTNFNHESIAKRLKNLRKEKGYSQAFVANALSITQAAYSRIENSNNTIQTTHIIRLSELYRTTTDYILRGVDNLTEVSYESGFFPLITSKAHAGFINNPEEVVNYDERDWFKVPGFNPSQDFRLFEIEGESMVPTIFPGDIIICQVQPNIKNLLHNSLVVLVTDKEVVAKRFDRLQKDRIILQNDNSAFPEQQVEFKLSQVQQVLNIRGKISSVLVPNHRVLSHSKVQTMEETIDWLKKEMFSLNNQLQVLRKKK